MVYSSRAQAFIYLPLIGLLTACTSGAGFSASGPAAPNAQAAAEVWSAREVEIIAAFPQRKAAHGVDAALEARIAQIIADMTLEQKVGQMTQAEIRSITPDQVRAHYIGSILNGGGAWPGMNKHASLADWTNLADSFAKASLSTNMAVKIPLIWGTDAIHGHNNVVGATLFPHNIGLGAAGDPDLVERIGRATAKQVRATGIGLAFAPAVSVAEDPRWGRAYESYSSDPKMVAKLGGALVRGLQGQLTGDGDVAASVKHFIGDGGTFRGIDQGENQSVPSRLASVHGAGYYAALDAGVATVMISYNSWSPGGAEPFGKMHGNRALITGVLKQKLKFDGLVISDWNAIEQVEGCERDHCPQAINAGVDLFMVPDNWKTFIERTVADVREGRVAMARIDDAVARILRVKFRTGLFDKPVSAGRYTGDANALVDRPLAQEAVRKSVVLLKNNSGTLPLRTGKRILVVGTSANSFPDQAGGWSITWQGDETDNHDYPVGETLLDGVRRVYGAEKVTFSADGSAFAPGKFDAVVMVMGETPHAEMKGDVRWPAPLAHSVQYPAQRALLDKARTWGVPIVSVLYSGRTVYANDLINRSDAFIAAFLPGTEAGALADVLAGKNRLDFSGKLSFNWPNTPCLSPGDLTKGTMFPRGYGLSYRKPRTQGRLVETQIPATCH